MEVQQHEALLEHRQILTGDVDHAAVAVAERDALPIIQKMRSDPDMTEIDPYARMKGSARLNSLTASTLNGKGMLVAPPVVFYNKDRTEVMAVTHLGKQLCGHDGIIHGGMLATLLDEILACAAMPALPGNVGFTANLNINYRRPVQSHQWVVLRGRLDRAEGRKAFVEAWIEDLDGNKCVEATSLYIAPKTPLARIL
ncbi:HotDog domain-containing protein [Gongronella butleri]|nr:HotDog domain-containing protein [Gongronella butleri]